MKLKVITFILLSGLFIFIIFGWGKNPGLSELGRTLQKNLLRGTLIAKFSGNTRLIWVDAASCGTIKNRRNLREGEHKNKRIASGFECLLDPLPFKRVTTMLRGQLKNMLTKLRVYHA